MTVRKNFNFNEEVAEHLEKIAKIEEKTQTQVVQEAITRLYQQINIKEKLAIFDEIEDSFHGMLTNIDAKSARKEHIMDKYGK